MKKSKKNLIPKIGIVLIVLWAICMVIGWEMEREGLFLWGLIFDFICWADADVWFIIIICIGAMPFVAYFALIWWLLN